MCVLLLVLLTHAIDELPQTGVVAEQTESAASNTAIDNELTENRSIDNNEHWNAEDPGTLESGKTEEKVITSVKKVNNLIKIMKLTT